MSRQHNLVVTPADEDTFLPLNSLAQCHEISSIVEERFKYRTIPPVDLISNLPKCSLFGMENHYYNRIDFSFFFIFFMVKDKTIFYLKNLLSITTFIDFL